MIGHQPPVVSILLVVSAASAIASDLDEFKVKRQEVYEFTEKPKVVRDGDTVTVTFTSKAFCDATVAVEDGRGRVVRHLASGVLGAKAPEPFQKNSLRQTLVWDGKDDKGEYVDDKDGIIVRVSLGLKPQFERSLYQSPYKRFGRTQQAFAPAPEGIYVYEGDMADSVRLFDHDGNYVRTVYPFPSGKLKQVKGLRWHQAPQDGVRVPFKEGSHQATFLGSGYNGGYDPGTGYGKYRLLALNHYDGFPSFRAASAIAVCGERMALTGRLLVRMATDGGTPRSDSGQAGGVDLHGPKIGIAVTERRGWSAPFSFDVSPRTAAFSPDGKWLYMAGHNWNDNFDTGGSRRRWLHAVWRVKFDGQAAPKVFAGAANNTPGSGPGQLHCAVSVACDKKGYVYVADYLNNRIQVFAPDGTLKESIPANRPAHVAVHQKTGEIYVFSWLLGSEELLGKKEKVTAVLTRLGPLGKHQKIASCSLPFGSGLLNIWDHRGGTQFRMELDSWAKVPTLWVISGPNAGIKLMTFAGGKLIVKRTFDAEARKATVNLAPTTSRQRLTVNPKTGRLYVQEGVASGRIVEIDPDTGRERLVNLPFAAEDLCFDIDGMAYLRTWEVVARYDPSNWREVPWDYGEKRSGMIAALPLPATPPGPWGHLGGFGISPKGHLAVQCSNRGTQVDRSLKRSRKQAIQKGGGKPYTPRLYPGRQRWNEIHVWDKHGKPIYKDATPGVVITDGVAIDKDDNIYVLTNPARMPGGKHLLNSKTETLIKFKPRKGRVISSGERPAVRLKPGQEPKGPPQMGGFIQSPAWIQGAEWMYGGVGYSGTGRCVCWNARFALDYFARSFAPEPDRFTVAVLDTNGNLIMRIGKYGNLDDGKPLVPDPAIKQTCSIGGDEVAIMHSCYVGVHSDKRLFIADVGNRRIASVKLGYHTEEKVALKDVPDRKETNR